MPASPGQTTGFNSVSDYLAANQGTLDREAGDINAQIGSELDSAKTAADTVAKDAYGNPDYTALTNYKPALDQQNKAQQDAELTKSQGGLQQLLAPQHGTAFDASLLGAHGGFTGNQKRADSLHDYLNTTAQSGSSIDPRGQIDPGRTPGDSARPDVQPPAATPPPASPLQNPPGTPPWGGPPQGTAPWNVGTPQQRAPTQPDPLALQPRRSNPLMGYL